MLLICIRLVRVRVLLSILAYETFLWYIPIMNYTPRKEYRLADETIEMSEIDALRDWLATNPWLTQHTLVQ